MEVGGQERGGGGGGLSDSPEPGVSGNLHHYRCLFVGNNH